MTEMEAAAKIAGMRDGYRKAEETEAVFGLKAHEWPTLIHIHRSGLVSRTEKARKLATAHAAWTKANLHALGIAC
jgi:hypothetical protein